MAKFHSSKSTKPLIPEDNSKPTTPDLNKPTKKAVTVSKPADEVHWITKPSSAMERVDDPVESKEAKPKQAELDAALLAQPIPEPAEEKKDTEPTDASQPTTAGDDQKVSSASKWMEDQPAEPTPTKEQLKDAQNKELAEAAALAAAATAVKAQAPEPSKSELPKEFQITDSGEDSATPDVSTADKPTPPVEVVTDSPNQSSGRNKKIIIAVIIIILLLLGAGVGGWLVLGSHDTDPTDQSASTTTEQASTSADVDSQTDEPSPTPTATPTPTSSPTSTPTATPSPSPTAAPTVVPTSSTTVESLWLTAVKATAGAQLSWKLGGSAPQGIDVMWSKSDNPTVPNRAGDQSVHVGPDVTSYTVTGVQLGQTYYFRVGVSNSTGGTRWYSNSVAITF